MKSKLVIVLELLRRTTKALRVIEHLKKQTELEIMMSDDEDEEKLTEAQIQLLQRKLIRFAETCWKSYGFHITLHGLIDIIESEHIDLIGILTHRRGERDEGGDAWKMLFWALERLKKRTRWEYPHHRWFRWDGRGLQPFPTLHFILGARGWGDILEGDPGFMQGRGREKMSLAAPTLLLVAERAYPDCLEFMAASIEGPARPVPDDLAGMRTAVYDHLGGFVEIRKWPKKPARDAAPRHGGKHEDIWSDENSAEPDP